MTGCRMCKTLHLQFHRITLADDGVQFAQIECLLTDALDIRTDSEMFDIRQLECLFGYHLHLVAQYQGVNVGVHERERIDGLDIVADDDLVKITFSEECHLTDVRYGVCIAGIGVRHGIRNDQHSVLYIHTTTQII